MFQSKKDLMLNAFRRNFVFGLSNLLFRKLDNKSLPEKCRFLPTSIQVEATTKCNLNCVMCEHTYLKEKGIDLDLKTFEKILQGNRFIELVNLTGIGEALLNKDFFKIVEAAKKKNIYVWFNDNFTLMNENNARKIIELGVDALAVSLDGATKKTFELIRKGANFEKVTANLRNFLKIQKEMNTKKPRVFIVTVVMKENIREIPQIIELASELGIKNVFFVGVLTFKENEKMSLENLERKTLKQIFEETKKKAIELNVEIGSMPSLTPSKNICTYPWNSLYITASGDVLPCCFVTQRNDKRIQSEAVLGNVKQEKLSEIWNCEKYRRFRRRLKEKNLPKICKNCHKISSIY